MSLGVVNTGTNIICVSLVEIALFCTLLASLFFYLWNICLRNIDSLLNSHFGIKLFFSGSFIGCSFSFSFAFAFVFSSSFFLLSFTCFQDRALMFSPSYVRIKLEFCHLYGYKKRVKCLASIYVPLFHVVIE